jgi:hypothetical protein
VASTEDKVQSAVYAVYSISVKYSVKISVNKAKTMGVKGKMNVRTKMTINNSIIERVNSFSYLGYAVAVTENRFKNKKDKI